MFPCNMYSCNITFLKVILSVHMNCERNIAMRFIKIWHTNVQKKTKKKDPFIHREQKYRLITGYLRTTGTNAAT